MKITAIEFGKEKDFNGEKVSVRVQAEVEEGETAEDALKGTQSWVEEKLAKIAPNKELEKAKNKLEKLKKQLEELDIDEEDAVLLTAENLPFDKESDETVAEKVKSAEDLFLEQIQEQLENKPNDQEKTTE